MENTSITFELGLCYQVTKIDGTKISFVFCGGEPPCGKLLGTGEKILMSVLLNKITNCSQINCPKV